MARNEHDEDLATFGWPMLLTTRRAIAYTGQSRHAICRAVKAGELVAVGRRGRSFVFRRPDLDAWMCGGREAAADGKPLATVIPIARAKTPLSESLKRIRRAAGRDEG